MFSATKGARSGKLVTQTFTSNTTWVAPTTTGYLVSAAGYGNSATSDAYNSAISVGSFFAAKVGGTSRSNPPYAQWGSLYAYLNDAIAVASASSTLRKAFFPRITTAYFIGTDDTWSDVNFSGEQWLTGNTYSVNANGSPPTSGDIVYATLSPNNPGWTLVCPGYVLGSAGTAATGFGKTFPGGTLTGSEPTRTAVAASTTTFTNVPVTPGASYAIVVPSGGSLTITYIE